MNYHMRNHTRLARFAICCFILLLLAGSFAAAARPALAEDDAGIAVTLHAIPSIKVARGNILAYKLRIDNYGDTTMAYSRIHLPYDRSKITLVDTLFETERDFIESIEENRINVYIDELGKDAVRFAVLYMYVNETLPDNTVIPMWAGYDWEDKSGNYGLDEQSNSAPVLVSDHHETSDFVWMTIDQAQAPQGTTFRFFSDRFLPGEEVRVWLRGPNGGEERRLGDKYENDADPNGHIHVHLESNGMIPGTYELTLRGHRSELQAAQNFTVLPPYAHQ